jgi:hypothetical protein
MWSSPRSCLSVLLTLTLAACSVASEDPPAQPGSPDAGADQPGQPGPDAGGDVAACSVHPGGYDLNATGVDAVLYPAGENVPTILELGALFRFDDPALRPLVVYLDLVDGRTVFADGFTAGTFTIAGAETDLRTCGVCLLLYGDVDEATGEAKQVFLAQAGTVTIDEVTPTPGAGRLRGTATDVVLERLDLDTLQIVNDGCETSLRMAFDGGVIAPGP